MRKKTFLFLRKNFSITRHWKLGISISMYCIFKKWCKISIIKPYGNKTILPAIIKPHPGASARNCNKTILPAIIKPQPVSARNCIVPPCHWCLLAHARKRTPNVWWSQLIEDHEWAIMKDQYKVGDFVSTDQFICKTPGRLPTGYGRKSQYCHFSGDTIFNDGASGLIWVKN